MKQPKLIKLYIQQGRFLPFEQKGRNPFAKFVLKFGNGIFLFCYFIGAGLIMIVKLVFKGLQKAISSLASGLKICVKSIGLFVSNEVNKTRRSLKVRWRLFKTKIFGQTLAQYFLLAVFVGAVIAGFKGINYLFVLKDRVTNTAALGNKYLTEAVTDAGNKNFDAAAARFALAEKTFDQGQEQLFGSGQALNQFALLLPPTKDASRLLTAAALISHSGQNFIALQAELSQLTFSQNGLQSGGKPSGEILTASDNLLRQSTEQIDQASSLIEKVDPKNLPGQYSQNFGALKQQLTDAQFSLNNFSGIFSLIKNLISGQKTILFLFENNNELRPSGGFMGTFGSLQMQDGQMQKLNVSSIYDLDGQLKQTVQPPLPVLNVNSIWSLRDSNWFADFPASAEKIQEFYEMDGGQTPDEIVVLTPQLIVNWLKITGPINLPKYNVTLTADNFVEQTQVLGSVSDYMPTNSPKQIFADLVPVLLQKISKLDKSQWPQILQGLQDALANKQMALYSRDPEVEKQLEDFNWAGNLAVTDRDYLSVVSSNLGATKTDLQIAQNIKLDTEISGDGTIIDSLEFTRTNANADLPDMQNESFIRVYAPLGSKLIAEEGFDKKDLQYPPGMNYVSDPDIHDWNKNSVTDNLTGTMIGQETGKTFFGNWVILKPGETRTIKLSYQLPFNLGDVDRYSLTLQKQLGSLNQNFSWALNFPGRKILWKNFENSGQTQTFLNSDILLNKDYSFGVVLEK